MSSGVMLGVDHIGVGVSEMERSKAFWAEVGFTDVAFDYQGPLAGPTGTAEAHVVWLRPGNPTVLGSGAVKLVALADPPPMPEGMAWGERGVCEVCVHVKAQDKLYERLVAAGHPALMEPNSSPLDPFGTLCSLSYVADPDGTKIELIEWLDYEQPFPWEDGPQGVNHVAFGVYSIERTRAFYQDARLRRDGLRLRRRVRADGPVVPLRQGAADEDDAAHEPVRRGHGARRVLPAVARHARRVGSPRAVRLRRRRAQPGRRGARSWSWSAEPFTVELGDGASWRYAYFADPDGTLVCLSETRF